MKIYSPTLFIEINYTEFIFAVGDETGQDSFKLIHKSINPIQGIESYKITDFDLVFNIIKKNIYLVEQELKFTFKDVVLIINNFRRSFINLTGYQKLNGSQILKENITYILNSLKSSIDETESKKTILHIFNSKYNLDKKKIENLPIGLFGDFYSHELSFSLINDNDYKNINNIFDKCNLKIKKILLKSFVEGSHISDKNNELSTFFKIKINENNSQIFYFENDALKFEQNFNFGSNLIIQDISKITALEKDVVKKIINNIKLTTNIPKDALIEKDFFHNKNYIKIKKKLLLEIAEARIQELIEIVVTKNVNLTSFYKKNNLFFLKINDESHFQCFKDTYEFILSKNNNLIVKFIENTSTEDFFNSVNKLVNFGWKKEAIPITQRKKSIIAKFFEVFFN
jgi:cell division protein FtsA